MSGAGCKVKESLKIESLKGDGAERPLIEFPPRPLPITPGALLDWMTPYVLLIAKSQVSSEGLPPMRVPVVALVGLMQLFRSDYFPIEPLILNADLLLILQFIGADFTSALETLVGRLGLRPVVSQTLVADFHWWWIMTQVKRLDEKDWKPFEYFFLGNKSFEQHPLRSELIAFLFYTLVLKGSPFLASDESGVSLDAIKFLLSCFAHPASPRFPEPLPPEFVPWRFCPSVQHLATIFNVMRDPRQPLYCLALLEQKRAALEKRSGSRVDPALQALQEKIKKLEAELMLYRAKAMKDADAVASALLEAEEGVEKKSEDPGARSGKSRKSGQSGKSGKSGESGESGESAPVLGLSEMGVGGASEAAAERSAKSKDAGSMEEHSGLQKRITMLTTQLTESRKEIKDLEAKFQEQLRIAEARAKKIQDLQARSKKDAKNERKEDARIAAQAEEIQGLRGEIETLNQALESKDKQVALLEARCKALLQQYQIEQESRLKQEARMSARKAETSLCRHLLQTLGRVGIPLPQGGYSWLGQSERTDAQVALQAAKAKPKGAFVLSSGAPAAPATAPKSAPGPALEPASAASPSGK